MAPGRSHSGQQARGKGRRSRCRLPLAGGRGGLLLALALVMGAAPPLRAQPCEELTGVFASVLTGATAGESASAGSCGGDTAPEHSFTYTAPRAGTYTIDTIGSEFDTVLYLRDGLGAELACNDDATPDGAPQSRVKLFLQAEQTVEIVVDGKESQSGNFTLRINPTCPAPFLGDPRDLVSPPSTLVSGSTTCAADSVGGATCGSGGTGTPDATFVYTAPYTGTFVISTEGSAFDTLLYVRLGTCAGTELACNDDIEPGVSTASRVSVDLTTGASVVIAVDGQAGASGAFALSIVSSPATPTPTGTRTNTREPTATRTPTPTPSTTATRTATPSRTVTATRSETATRTVTRTPTASATSTQTRTPTNSATPTATRTPTVTATATRTRTPTRTATDVPTHTPTRTPTGTRPVPPSETPTETPGGEPTTAATATATPTAGSPTSTPTETTTPQPSDTTTATPTGTRSATPSASATGSPPPDGTRTFTPSTTATATSAASPTASPSPTSAPSGTPSATQMPSATHTRLPTATPTATVAAASITLLPVRGIPGGAFQARGQVRAGAPGVRVLWDDGVSAGGLADGPVSDTGRFSLTLIAPADARAGEVQVCAMANGPGAEGRDLACAPYTLLRPPPAAIVGVVEDAAGQPLPDADVRVMTTADTPVAALISDVDGAFAVVDLSPGEYVLSARCPPTGPETCLPERDRFDPLRLTLEPGATLSPTLRPAAAPANTAALSSFGGIALPGGLLVADNAVQVTNADASIAAELGSLAALGLPPIAVRFWADVQFFTAPPAAGAVSFEIVHAGQTIVSRLALLTQPVSVVDPPYAFDAYVFDVNVNDLPAGDLLLRITPLIDGTALPPHEFTLRLVDLGSRWFADWTRDPLVSAHALEAGGLAYDFSGSVPLPPFAFSEPIELPFDTTLVNAVSLVIPVEETFRTDGTWSGTSMVSVDATVLGQALQPEMRIMNGPTGTVFEESTYGLGATPLTAVTPDCLSAPVLSDRQAFTVAPCTTCTPVTTPIGVGAATCHRATATVAAQTDPQLRLAASVTPHLTAPPTVQTKIDASLCAGTATLAAAASADLPIVYDAGENGTGGFVDPCLRLQSSVDYQYVCSGIEVERIAAPFPELNYGCASGGPAAGRGPLAARRISLAYGDLSPSPAVAVDGNGDALALWVQEVGDGGGSADRRLYYSAYQAGAWSAPTEVVGPAGLVETPQVQFVSPGRALAVWVRNELTPDAALSSDPAAILGATELYWATWQDGGWSPATRLTIDDLADTTPALAADRQDGTAVLAWLRGRDPTPAGSAPVGVHAAVFDGTAWSAPEPIGPASAGVDHRPAVAVDRTGVPVAAWERDTLIVLARRDGGTWGAPQPLPGLPPGAHTPALAINAENQPLLVFVVAPPDAETGQPGIGDGNASTLYAALGRGGAWEVVPVGQETRAERPVVVVTADDRAVAVFRRFGTESDVHLTGDLAAATADLHSSPLTWSGDFLTADGQVNWEVAAAVDPSSASTFVVNVKKAQLAPADDGGAERRQATRNGFTVADGDTIVAGEVLPDLADLAIDPGALQASNSYPSPGETVNIAARVANHGLRSLASAQTVTVSFYDGDTPIGTRSLPGPLAFGAERVVSLGYRVDGGGRRTLRAIVDEAGVVPDADQTNNVATVEIGIPPAPSPVAGAVLGRDGSLMLQWDPSPGAVRYAVYRSSSTDPATLEVVGMTSASRFVDPLAHPGTPYVYAVAAIDAFGVASPLSPLSAIDFLAAACAGDCHTDGVVTVDELVFTVGLAQNAASIDLCPAATSDGETVTGEDLVRAVTAALYGCGGAR